MKIGVYSDSLPKLNRRELFAWCAERGVTDIELGVGAWGPWPRPHLDIATVSTAAERDRLRGELREFGIRLAAVNAAGNLLHPDPAKRLDAQTRFRAAVDLAVALGVKRVITMSGCPAGAGGGSLGVFPCWATSADDERLFDWQMANEVGPYWHATSEWLAKLAPDMMVCLELHPGVTRVHGGELRGAAAPCRPEYRSQHGPQPFLVAGNRPGDRDRGVWRPHRLRPRQGHAALSGAHPPAGRAASRAAERSVEGAVAFRFRWRGARRRRLDGADQGAAEGRVRRRHLDRARGPALRRRGGDRPLARRIAARAEAAGGGG